ncbi:MAG: DUF3786 domain-containing protein [Candidatus Latescibacteria bacterium]|jgi:hypothetical protein|nr:DUF3786 domain-containing protein [Candidatus Latescibacterota bacterium]
MLEKGSLKPPEGDSWQQAWELAVDLTVAKLAESDLEDRCKKSGAQWDPDSGMVEIAFLGDRYRVPCPEFTVARLADGGDAPITERILLLHYLVRATGAAPTDEWIGFVEVPGAELYLANFRARSVDRLVRAYSGREEELVGAAAAVGGQEADHGDVAVCLQALPNVPVMVTLWRGDDEFAPSGNLLFDSTVVQHLSIEDMVVLAGTIASRLCQR